MKKNYTRNFRSDWWDKNANKRDPHQEQQEASAEKYVRPAVVPGFVFSDDLLKMGFIRWANVQLESIYYEKGPTEEEKNRKKEFDDLWL